MLDTGARLTVTLRRGGHMRTQLVSASRRHVRSDLAPARQQRAAGSEPIIDWPEAWQKALTHTVTAAGYQTAANGSGSGTDGSPARATV